MIRLAIDVGSRVTKIYKLGCGVVLAEATCLAVESNGDKIEYKAFGDKAKALSGKAAQNTHIVNPVKEGDIDNIGLLAQLLIKFFEKIEIKLSQIKKCEVLFVLPCGFTQALKDKYVAVAQAVGIGRVSYVSLPYAAVIGHNVTLSESAPVFCLDIGYAVTNVATLSLDGIISGFTINLGGGNIDVHLMDLVAESLSLRIGSLTAEKLKNSVCNLLKHDNKLAVIEGRSARNGAPASQSIRSSQLYDVVSLYVDKILEYTAMVLNKLPAEVAAAVMNGGIYLSGGVAKMDGLPEYIEEKLGISVHVSEDSSLCSVIGAGQILASDNLRARLTMMD